jgi:hypothetical protein
MADNGYGQGGVPVLTTPGAGTAMADNGYGQGGDSANGGTGAPRSNARTGDVGEMQSIENSSLPPSTSFQGSDAHATPEQICQLLVETLCEACKRGARPRRAYEADRDGWHQTAARLLGEWGPQRLVEVIVDLPRDRASIASVSDLEQKFEDLSHRENSRRLTASPAAQSAHQQAGRPSWPQARTALEDAVRRFGRGRESEGLAALHAGHELFAVLAREAGWIALCEGKPSQWNQQLAGTWRRLLASPSHVEPDQMVA